MSDAPTRYEFWWRAGSQEFAERVAREWNRAREKSQRSPAQASRNGVQPPRTSPLVRESPLPDVRADQPAGAPESTDGMDRRICDGRSDRELADRVLHGPGGLQLWEPPMTLHQAFAKAQSEFKPIRFDSQAQLGGGRNYRYASIAAILDGVRPILNKHGILLSQEPSQTDGVVSVTTRLSLGDQSISSTLSAPMSRGGFHELGSAITYLRRYGLASMLGVAAEEDEDGHAAQATAGAGNGTAAPKRARQGTAKPEPDAGGEAPSSAPPAGDRVVDVLVKRVNAGVSKRGTEWAIGTFQTEDGEEIRCGTFAKTWKDILVNEQRNTDRVWRLTISPPKKDGDAWGIENLQWVTESGELVDPWMDGIPF